MSNNKKRKQGIRKRARSLGRSYCQMLHFTGITPPGHAALVADLDRIVRESLVHADALPEDLPRVAAQLAADLATLNVHWASRIAPEETYPFEFALQIAQLVGDHYAEAGVSPREIYDLTRITVELIVPRFVPEPSAPFSGMCAGAVQDVFGS